MGKYIVAFTKEDKTQLEFMGFKFYMEQKVGRDTCYVFHNDSKSLNFSNETRSKYDFIDNLFMCI